MLKKMLGWFILWCLCTVFIYPAFAYYGQWAAMALVLLIVLILVLIVIAVYLIES